MSLYRFVGNPFVDAGIAAMCAAAGVDSPDKLDTQNISIAVDHLIRIMTSPPAMEPLPKRADAKTVNAFATSELSAIFPNGPHANPAVKKDKKASEYSKQIRALLDCLEGDVETGEFCFSCGLPAGHRATKTDFPLVDSAGRRNFHPGLTAGHPVCARCALAVQFLPFSLMRTNPSGGYFWFLSSMDPLVSVTASKELALRHMNDCVAAGRRVELFGDWFAASKNNAVVQSIQYLASNASERGLTEPSYPVRAIFFSNDNRGGDISTIDVPDSLFRFFISIAAKGSLNKFMNEVLYKVKFGESIAGRMIAVEHITAKCIVMSESEKDEIYPSLLGGWKAHRQYAKEMMKMQDRYIRIIEGIALRIADSEDPIKVLKAIKIERQPFNWFHRAISKGFVTKDEFYILAPPNDFKTAFTSLDYIRAATVDALRCKQEGEVFEPLAVDTSRIPETSHPIIQLVESVGATICDSGKYEPKRLYNHLRKARSQSDIRWCWLRVIEAGAINWSAFKQLVPPDGKGEPYVIKDYMLAFLADRLRGVIDIEEQEPFDSENGSEIPTLEEETCPTL